MNILNYGKPLPRHRPDAITLIGRVLIGATWMIGAYILGALFLFCLGIIGD
jgi:hypothetical protein